MAYNPEMAGTRFYLLSLAAAALFSIESRAQEPVIGTFRYSSMPPDFMDCNKSVYLKADSAEQLLIAGDFSKKGQSVMVSINGKMEKLRCTKPVKNGQTGEAIFDNGTYKAALSIQGLQKSADGTPNARLAVVRKEDGAQSAVPISSNVWTALCGGTPRF